VWVGDQGTLAQPQHRLGKRGVVFLHGNGVTQTGWVLSTVAVLAEYTYLFKFVDRFGNAAKEKTPFEKLELVGGWISRLRGGQ